MAEIPFSCDRTCIRCSAVLPAPGTCGECLITPPPWTKTCAVMRYGFPVPYLIHRFKYKHDLVTGQLLGKLFADRAAHFPRPDTLLAVPLSSRKQRQRGFNQAAELTRCLAGKLALPVLARAVIRRQPVEMIQSTLHSRAARIKNVSGVFHVKQSGLKQIKSKTIAIVDDVMTSGATATALSRVLLENGAAQVYVWVLARA